MTDGSLVVTKDARGIATVTLNRPEKRNVLDDRLIADLTKLFKELDDDRGVRALVIAGRGPAFSAGGDLTWMRHMGESSVAENLADATAICQLFRTLDKMRKPTVARVHGAVYAAGLGLVAACDIAVASEDAMFCVSEVRVGLVPSTISPYVVAAIGDRAARRYFLTAEPFTAAEAYRLGLVHQVVPPSALDDSVEKIISALLQGAPQSQMRAKQLIAALAGDIADDGVVALTARSMADARASLEAREGIPAFLEKRKPIWKTGS